MLAEQQPRSPQERVHDEFGARLRELMPMTRRDVRAFEDGPVERVRIELEAHVVGILRESDALLGEMLQMLAPVRVEESFNSAEWDFAANPTVSQPSAPSKVEIPLDGVLFMAQLEVRGRLDCHQKQADWDLTALLLECDASLRRLRKALAAVDRALSPHPANTELLDTPELQVSLAVRRLLAEFRRRIVENGEPSDAQLRARFRGAGTQIAMLVGHQSYADVRIRDRVLIQHLQRRILAWLRDGAEQPAEVGRRLWQDLTGCLQMFAQVNRRQELVAHDCALIEHLIELPVASEPEGWRSKCAALNGLNPELDMLCRDQGTRWLDVRAVLEGLHGQFASSRSSGEQLR